MLTSIKEVDDNLTIVLDDKLVLEFEGLQAVNPTLRDLTLGPFRILRFERIMGGQRLTKEYNGGEAKILLAPG